MASQAVTSNDGAAMSRAAIESELKRLAPFHHAIDLPHGLSTHLPEFSRQEREKTRLKTLIDHAWPSILEACGGSLKGKRVLDIACNCGGFAVTAAQAGADYVLGIDIEDHYLEQANFIRDALALDNLEYRKVHLEDLTPERVGRFDLILCFGILYHLENPVLSLKRIAGVADGVLVVDTTLMRIPVINNLLRRWPMWHMKCVPAVDDTAWNITTSRWRKAEFLQFYPNPAAVIELMRYVGFDGVRQLPATVKGLEPRYYGGTRATFIGSIDRPGA